MGFRIFLHSVRLVFNQLQGALRISGLLFLIISGLGLWASLAYPPVIVNGEARSVAWQFIALNMPGAILSLWIAVAWHRYVLIDEMPSSVLPPFRAGRMLVYFGRMIQAGLIALVIAVLYGVATFTLIAIAPRLGVVFSTITTIAFAVAIVLLSYRLAPMFPGAAVERPVGVKAAWAATKGANGSFIVLAIISVIASFIIDLPAYGFRFFPAISEIAAFIWLSITGWIKLIVGVSILTTIYGVYFEKRAIA